MLPMIPVGSDSFLRRDSDEEASGEHAGLLGIMTGTHPIDRQTELSHWLAGQARRKTFPTHVPARHSPAVSIPLAPVMHLVPSGELGSPGQSGEVPVHLADVLQTPISCRQVTPAKSRPQVPSDAEPRSFRHARQSLGLSLPHAVSQDTPSTQNPLAQCHG